VYSSVWSASSLVTRTVTVLLPTAIGMTTVTRLPAGVSGPAFTDQDRAASGYMDCRVSWMVEVAWGMSTV
jgi:hypothetical protein